MTVKEFREKVKPFLKLSVESKDFLIKEVVKFRFDDDSFYIKCWLSEDNNYLSLGIDDKTGERSDFYGRIINNDLVEIHGSTI